MTDSLENKRNKADVCAVCGKKLGLSGKMIRNANSHILMDAVPCQACHLKLWRLLMHRELWVDEETYLQAMEQNYDYRKEYILPLEKAKTLLALRDSRCQEVCKVHSMEKGSVFAVQQSFQVPPKPPIFILRARKVRNRAVVQGLSIRGEFKKGGRAAVQVDGKVIETEIVDAISFAQARKSEGFTRTTFLDELTTNVHNHTVAEGEEGWLILDIEAEQLLHKGGFVVGKEA